VSYPYFFTFVHHGRGAPAGESVKVKLVDCGVKLSFSVDPRISAASESRRRRLVMRPVLDLASTTTRRRSLRRSVLLGAL